MKKKIHLTDPIESHVAWAFEHIYSKPYKSYQYSETSTTIARLHHGIQHVTRAAIYAPILANLYRRYGDLEALQLTNDDIHLIQISLLFHDSAREGDGEDKWDRESAALLGDYLKNLKVQEKKAALLVEAVANKDAIGYDLCFMLDEHEEDINIDADIIYIKNLNDRALEYAVRVDENKVYRSLISVVDINLNLNKISQELLMRIIPITLKRGHTTRKKNIYQKLIHDADCLDIIRARPHFDAHYLDFYQEIAINNARAFEEMAQLIKEIRSVTEAQGDYYEAIRLAIKAPFESKSAYSLIKKSMLIEDDINSQLDEKRSPLTPSDPRQYYVIIPSLFKLLPAKQITELSLAIPPNPRLLFRSVLGPSCLRLTAKEKKRGDETCASVEIRKFCRGPDTGSSKNGSPNRSMSFNGFTYSDSGFYTTRIPLKQIVEISPVDYSTGRFKKENYKTNLSLTDAEKEIKLQELEKNLKMGGNSVSTFKNQICRHNELIVNINDNTFTGIFFTADPNVGNSLLVNSCYPYHRYVPALNAIFLQNEYKKQTGKTLPIMEYLVIRGDGVERKFTESEITTMWVTMCQDYLQRKFENDEGAKAIEMSRNSETLEMQSMYAYTESFLEEKYKLNKRNGSALSNYDPELQGRIRKAIKTACDLIILDHHKHIESMILKEEKLLISPIFDHLIHYTDLSQSQKIKDKVHSFLQSSYINEWCEYEFKNILNAYNPYYWFGETLGERLDKIYQLSLKYQETGRLVDYIRSNVAISLSNRMVFKIDNAINSIQNRAKFFAYSPGRLDDKILQRQKLYEEYSCHDFITVLKISKKFNLKNESFIQKKLVSTAFSNYELSELKTLILALIESQLLDKAVLDHFAITLIDRCSALGKYSPEVEVFLDLILQCSPNIFIGQTNLFENVVRWIFQRMDAHDQIKKLERVLPFSDEHSSWGSFVASMRATYFTNFEDLMESVQKLPDYLILDTSSQEAVQTHLRIMHLQHDQKENIIQYTRDTYNQVISELKDSKCKFTTFQVQQELKVKLQRLKVNFVLSEITEQTKFSCLLEDSKKELISLLESVMINCSDNFHFNLQILKGLRLAINSAIYYSRDRWSEGAEIAIGSDPRFFIHQKPIPISFESLTEIVKVSP